MQNYLQQQIICLILSASTDFLTKNRRDFCFIIKPTTMIQTFTTPGKPYPYARPYLSISVALRFRILLFTILLAFISTPSSGWSLKTHVWIAQQVINDIVDDGMVNIAGKNYPVSERIVAALRQYPDRYRMGALGPDVFPDPIVGQTTTHPGVDGGWQTDEWLQHLLDTAETPEEIAFAYGFSAHAAGDIFAHTYVNAYAGDFFDLLDTERSVELRHFTLEKYIESLTPHPHTADGKPIDWKTALGTPVGFIRDQLILNGAAAKQNIKAKSGAHLAAMYGVSQGVKGLEDATGKLIGTITDGAATYYKKQIELQVDFTTGKHALDAAELNLKAQNEILVLRKKALEVAEDALRKAKNIIDKNPVLISAQTALLAEQIKVAADATAFSVRTAADVNQTVDDLNGKISGLRGEVASLACYLLFWPKEIEDCKKEVKRANNKVSDIERTITGQKARAKIAKQAAENADRYRDEIKKSVDNLRTEYEKAIVDVTNAVFETAILAAEADIKFQEKAVEHALKGVEKAQQLQEKFAKEIKNIDGLIDEIAKAIKRYNAVTIIVQNWSKGIQYATDEYVKASHEAGIKMLTNSGKPFDDYKRWYTCYSAVYFGIPYQGADAVCTTKDFINEAKLKYNEAIDGLPPVLKWAIFPSRQVSQLAFKKLEPQIEKAKFELIKFLTDKATADFITLLSNPEMANRKQLNMAYSSDKSGKNLLCFVDVASIVEKDLKINNGKLDTDQFRPIANSITMAKLTLLDAATLNKVIADFTGEYASSYFGKDVYKGANPKSTLLTGAIRSIDGNHQWQAYGLPYPRSDGHKHPVNIGKNNYGYNYYTGDHSKGFRLWVDPFLRTRVFAQLFPGPVLGALGERAELKDGLYNFVECPQNAYPSTQEIINGKPADSDLVCRSIAQYSVDTAQVQFKSLAEYANTYFQNDSTIIGKPYWTVVASFLTSKSAFKRQRQLASLFPDIYTQIWMPRHSNRYWTIMSACTTREYAIEARNIAIIRGIAPDAFVWKPGYPWVKSSAPIPAPIPAPVSIPVSIRK